MKSIFQSGYILYGALLISVLLITHVKATDSFAKPKKESKMNTAQNQDNNKAAVRNLYEDILNNRKLELLKDLISDEYTGIKGKKGVSGFEEPILDLIKAFPDIQWKIEELIGEGDKVAVSWKTQGTHKAEFLNIEATDLSITNHGTAIYEFKNGKIINVQVLTDRLGFLQQLSLLPFDLTALTNKNPQNNYIFFIDKFYIPKNSINEFTQRMNYNRNFIKNLPGFIQDEVYEQTDEDGNMTIITIATWKNQEQLNKAKSVVQDEYKRIGFDPAEFFQRLNIKPERGLYQKMND